MYRDGWPLVQPAVEVNDAMAHIPRLLAPLVQMILSVTTVLPYVELHSALLMTGTVTLRSGKKIGLIAESAIQFFIYL